MSEQLVQIKPFYGKHYAMQFMPGDWWQWRMEDDPMSIPIEDMFCIHYSAQEPTTAHFEVALDGVIQDYEIIATVPTAYVHNLVAGKCNNPRTITIKRKETDEDIPVFVIYLDGVPQTSYLREEMK